MSQLDQPEFQIPLVLKTEGTQSFWPGEGNVSYVAARNGYFLARRHEFFHSIVRSQGPGELADQWPVLIPRFPVLPKSLFAQILGFFAFACCSQHDAEAMVLLVWNRQISKAELVVPEQEATVAVSQNGKSVPIKLNYTNPLLPTHMV